MQRLKKSLGERIGHAVLFEVIALGVCAPLFSWLMGTSLFEMGALTLAISLIAMVWNVVYNGLFDRLQRRLGFTRSLGVRMLHAGVFEAGLIVATVPLAAAWLGISLWSAFVLDIGFLLFFLPYTVAFNWIYDHLRGQHGHVRSRLRRGVEP